MNQWVSESIIQTINQFINCYRTLQRSTMTVSHKQSLEAGSRSLGLKCVLYLPRVKTLMPVLKQLV